MDSFAKPHAEPLSDFATESHPTAAAMSTSSSNIPIPSVVINPFDPRYPLPSNQPDPLYLVAPQTWAQRNPNLGTQPERHRAKITAAAKATRKITTARNKANAALLSADIEKQVELQRAQIEKIAEVHNRKVSEIDKLITHHTNYRQSRAPSLANALTHKKGVEMNEGSIAYIMRELY
jgi:hypothetical protein